MEDSLKEIKDQTNTALTTVSSQTKKVDDSLSSLETVLKELKEGDEKRDEEFKNVKSDIDALKDLVPKVVKKELSNERGLKANILSYIFHAN